MQVEKTLTLFKSESKTLTLPRSASTSKRDQLGMLHNAIKNLRESKVPTNEFDETCTGLMKFLERDISELEKNKSVDLSNHTAHCFAQPCSFYSKFSAAQVAVKWIDDNQCCPWIIENNKSFNVACKYHYCDTLCTIVTEEVCRQIAGALEGKRAYHNLFILESLLTGIYDVFLHSKNAQLSDRDKSKYEMLEQPLNH